eukprot:TRINITY_DN4490_c1_g2_i1.p1 TRINITY_DN4490_c1_g2~~TRINITY_DN4490_c1_g2_i1.p1  ORF type:complete len:624 (+),score=131.54 TRINITY_DN4490_c1_g2_i1:159-2030(+)
MQVLGSIESITGNNSHMASSTAATTSAGTNGVSGASSTSNSSTASPSTAPRAVGGWRNPLHEAVWTRDHAALRRLAKALEHHRPSSMGDTPSPTMSQTHDHATGTGGEEGPVVGLEEEESRYTALYVASLRGELEAARILLEAGADVNNGGSQGTPPLFNAAAKGHLPLVLLFVMYECKVALEDTRQGCSAIHIAADKGHTPVIEALLHSGADVGARSTNGEMTPLHHAASCGRLEAVQKLIESGADVNAVNSPGNTPLILATNKGHQQVVQCLLANGADVRKHCIKDGFTALHSAACFGYPNLAQIFIDAGADVNAAFDPFLHTPLHLAAAKGQIDLLMLLIHAGAKVNARNKPGASPLRLAASNESELVDKNRFLLTCKHLIAAGADINAQNDQGNTALHGLIVKEGTYDNIRFCIENGADPHLRNRDGKSSVDLVNNSTVRALLLSKDSQAVSGASDATGDLGGHLFRRSASFEIPPTSSNNTAIALTTPLTASLSSLPTSISGNPVISNYSSNTNASNNASTSSSIGLSPTINPINSNNNNNNTNSNSALFVPIDDWVKDADVIQCEGCEVMFNMFKRKHHCRLCGHIFCHDCSAQRFKNERVCNGCFAVRMSRSGIDI